MMRRSLDHPIVAFSVRVYQVFLFAYPTQFRQEYGLHMTQVFRDGCLRVVRQDGTNAMFKFWALTLLDLIQSVLSEHMQKETQMRQEMRPEDIRRSGWALILGGISFVMSIFVAIQADGDGSLFAMLLMIFVSLPLLVFGILGLRNRYGEKTGSFGRNILLLGAILGPVTSILGFFVMAINPLWFVIYTGPAVLFLCLTLFGIATSFAKALPRWNMLPILAGFSYPAIILFYILNALTTGDWTGYSVPDVVNIILITIQGIALLVLGYILKADLPEEKIVIA